MSEAAGTNTNARSGSAPRARAPRNRTKDGSCFKCGHKGHIAKECPTSEDQTSATVNTSQSPANKATLTTLSMSDESLSVARSSRAPLVDIGVNLAHRRFERDLTGVMERSLQSGVVACVVTGTSVRGSRSARRLCEIASSPGVLYFTAGIHPHDAKSWSDGTANALTEIMASPHCVAAGECGLDYDRNFSSPEQQRVVFARQLELAKKAKLPVFLHERDAHGDFVKIWHDAVGTGGGVKGCVHCFTGTEEELDTYLDMGMYIGITGFICNDKRSGHMHDWIKKIPLNRLMIETDAPFMAPSRSIKRCEPCHLTLVAEKMAKLMGVSVEELARATTATATEFFALPEVKL